MAQQRYMVVPVQLVMTHGLGERARGFARSRRCIGPSQPLCLIAVEFRISLRPVPSPCLRLELPSSVVNLRSQIQ